MKRPKHRIFSAVLLITSLISCREMSEIVHDAEAGLNGGFEVVKEGKPVNWLLYTMKTVPTGDFDISIDNNTYHGGNGSLRINVIECDPSGGNLSPGFATEIPATPDRNHSLSFWVKNNGTEFVVHAGGVSAMSGNMQMLVKSDESAAEWTYHEYTIPVSEAFDRFRISINVLSPGSFWIDDINIRVL